jgi:hypothetical protein
MTCTVIQSNNATYIGKQFTVDKKQVQIGSFFGTKIPFNEVTNCKTDVNQHVTKGMAGTIGGAIVGGILTGGVGAVVGGLACGNNKVVTSRQVALEFQNNDWIVVEFGTGWTDDIFFKVVQEKFSSIIESPFGNTNTNNGKTNARIEPTF